MASRPECADPPAAGAGPSIPGVGEAIQPFIDAHEIAGAVTLVATPEGLVHLEATGWADIGDRRPMRADTLFWIASMTKPVTAAAVMLLDDDGKLSVDDPVERYLPEFADLETADGRTARVTIRHLLTHTSGLAEITPDEARAATNLAELVPRYASRPVSFPPGTRWAYCQSGINTAARIVEVVSGEPFTEFLERRLFGPLGMSDTTFYLTEEQLPRLAASYRRNDGGALEETDIFILLGKDPTSRDRFPAANGGLFSTAPDYARFCRMVLRGGELDGRRYLSAEAVRRMTTVQTGDLATGFTDGNGWGLGWCVVREPQGATAVLSAGTHGHGGAYGTQAWIDPQAQRVYLLMVQRADFANADDSPVRRAFQEAAAGR
jgi:CubicO group peptidase (beta-lactamase class C family)